MLTYHDSPAPESLFSSTTLLVERTKHNATSSPVREGYDAPVDRRG